MKTQKRALALLIVLTLALSLVGCGGSGGSSGKGGSSNSLVGAWELTGGTYFEGLQTEGTITFEFKEGGSIARTINGPGVNETLNGTWEVSGDKVTMTVNHDTLSANFKISGKTLTMTLVDMGPEDGKTIVFTRK